MLRLTYIQKNGTIAASPGGKLSLRIWHVKPFFLGISDQHNSSESLLETQLYQIRMSHTALSFPKYVIKQIYGTMYEDAGRNLICSRAIQGMPLSVSFEMYFLVSFKRENEEIRKLMPILVGMCHDFRPLLVQGSMIL